MNKKIIRTIGVLLLLTAVAVTQVPVSDAEASGTASDFQMEGSKLLRYSGTAEVVSIPDDVQVIGEEAFAGNDHLVKVTIGGKVKRIGYGAFSDCDNLRTIAIGDRVEEIDSAAFSNDPALTHVTLGAGVKKLGSGVFAGDYTLTDLTVSDANTHLFMEDGILYGKEHETLYLMLPSSQREALVISNDVKSIMAYAFWGNTSLLHVQLGSGLKEVPSYAFSNCVNLEEVEIPLAVRSIGAKAFEDCVSLETATIPESVSSIHDTAFDGCPHVSVAAPEGSYAYQYAQSMKKTPVEQTEYEDVLQSQTISQEVLQTSEDTTDTSADGGEAEATAGAEDGMSQEDTTDTVQESEALTDTDSGSADEQESTGSADEQQAPAEPTGALLGQTSIVTGRAVVFIDNRMVKVRTGIPVSNATIDLSKLEETADEGVAGVKKAQDDPKQLSDLLADDAQKGKGFPKYTVVNGSIASQAYYLDTELTEYEFPEEVTQIGDFAFARSGLTSVEIPESVTRIGYGAFYHCDDLQSVTIPDSVTEIAAYAFDKTPFLENADSATYPFVIVGDGILIGYQGSDSVINIPKGVKQIAAGVFREHMGITAVNIPDTVEVIGEAAFGGCRNLSTVNGGRKLRKIGAAAFRECPLSNVTIPATVEEIGLSAYDLKNGTDTVVFEGSELPVLVFGTDAQRAANTDSRAYAFGDMTTAIVPSGVSDLAGTVLEDGIYGFAGSICTEQGQLLAKNQGVVSATAKKKVLTIPGTEESFILHVKESDEACRSISQAYGELYGGREPSLLTAYDLTLMDQTDTVMIKKLGKQSVSVSLPVPEGMDTDRMHVVTLDQDGQLEAVSYELIEENGEKKLSFMTNHFSPYGIYQQESFGGSGVVSNGKTLIRGTGARDATPDTGDFLHPKWFLAMGLTALSVLCFFYRDKTKTEQR